MPGLKSLIIDGKAPANGPSLPLSWISNSSMCGGGNHSEDARTNKDRTIRLPLHDISKGIIPAEDEDTQFEKQYIYQNATTLRLGSDGVNYCDISILGGELENLYRLWTQILKTAWKVPQATASIIKWTGALQLDHPRVILGSLRHGAFLPA
eukprot:271410-Hanusia_phi.AAC.1